MLTFPEHHDLVVSTFALTKIHHIKLYKSDLEVAHSEGRLALGMLHSVLPSVVVACCLVPERGFQQQRRRHGWHEAFLAFAAGFL